MFEDSTFESTGRIHTRSRGWMIAAFAFNASILLALVLIPLLYPQALPRMATIMLMETPLEPAPEPKPQTQPVRVTPSSSNMQGGHLQAPSVIPKGYLVPGAPEAAPPATGLPEWPDSGNTPGNGSNLFHGQPHATVVHPATTTKPVRISGSVVEGMLVQKTLPVYPPIAKATAAEGTVVLEATISRSGTIENLHVVSGPLLLQQAALDAVRTWRYRPYLLSGQPVEVETTVNVIFRLE